MREGNRKLLAKVASTHGYLVLSGQTSEAILVAAGASTSQKDFEARLSSLLPPEAAKFVEKRQRPGGRQGVP